MSELHHHTPDEGPRNKELPHGVLRHMLDDAETRMCVACAFLDGIGGVPQDFETAKYWFERAAEKGNVSAIYNLGCLYYGGDGVARDLVKAAEFFRVAVAKGNLDAQFNLAYMYEYGEGVEQDKEMAMRMHEYAATHGNMRSQFEMARKYDEGSIVEKDHEMAKIWATAAAKQGHPPSQCLLATLLVEESDMQGAMEWFVKAAECGDTLAQISLGQIYASGYGGVTKNLVLAGFYATLAARSGDEEGNRIISILLKKMSPSEILAMDEKLKNVRITSWDEARLIFFKRIEMM